MNKSKRASRRFVAVMLLSPEYYMLNGAIGGAVEKFVWGLREIADEVAAGHPHVRLDVLGSGYVREGSHSMFVGGAEPSPDSLPMMSRVERLRNRLSREMLLWWDAFYVVGLFDFDERSGRLLTDPKSFRNAVLRGLCSFEYETELPDLPPHFLDVPVQLIAQPSVVGGEE